MPVEFPEDLAAMFDPTEFGVPAVWKAGGAEPGIGVVVIRRRLGPALEFGDTRVRADRSVFVARAGELAGAAKGDVLVLGAETFRLTDVAPDPTGSVLTLDCAKVP